MAPDSSSRSSKSKKPSRYDSNEEDDKPSPQRHSSSSSSSKKMEKAPKTTLLKSMFTRDRSEAPAGSVLQSALFRDDEKKAGSSSSPKSVEAKHKPEKAKKEKLPDETYADEPDFSQFQSSFSEPVVERKPEKKREKPVEKKKEEKKKEEKKKEEKKKEIPRRESSRREKSPVRKADPLKAVKYESNSPSKGVAPPKFKTTFTSTYDISMASKQSKITDLQGEELVKQEKWAQEKLKAHAGTCPMGYNWHRFKQVALRGQVEMEGYRCLGGSHFVTHELLAEGKGEIYVQTFAYGLHVHNIRVSGLPVQTPYFGTTRWEGPLRPEELVEPAPALSMEQYALQIMPRVYGSNIHPCMIPIYQQELVQQMKVEEAEEKRALDEFLKRPGSKGGPWWEDLA